VKNAEQDWNFKILSLSPVSDPRTGLSILDKCWAIHASMPEYDEDIELFTQDHRIQHRQTNVVSAAPRYFKCYYLISADVLLQKQEEHDDWSRLWPAPPATTYLLAPNPRTKGIIARDCDEYHHYDY
jgi:hypothetical protein